LIHLPDRQPAPTFSSENVIFLVGRHSHVQRFYLRTRGRVCEG
jgi:hypothetical protein